jgi:hypothetical protein
MVEFNEEARTDLESIFDGLLAWRTPNGQFYLDTNTVINYHNDILDVCEQLDKLTYHTKAKYLDHLKFGNYVYVYKRNAKTTWYIIYNMNRNTVYVEKIMNNYLTKSSAAE